MTEYEKLLTEIKILKNALCKILNKDGLDDLKDAALVAETALSNVDTMEEGS